MQFSDLLAAYKSCRIGKPASSHQTRFEAKLGENLLQLTQEINSHKYKPSRSVCFIVTHPKPREIFAAHFRDRIIHHYLVSQLSNIWKPKFSPFSFACRKYKGTHGALNELQRQVRKISQGGNKTVYALQLDISSFFVTINRRILCELLTKHARDPELKWLINASIGHDARTNYVLKSSNDRVALLAPNKSWLSKEADQGLPIGNLTSQFGANAYMTETDHWIVRQLKPLGYLRYMDDLTLLHTNPDFLEPLIEPIDQWLRTHRKQELNHDKTVLKPLTDGIDYLGYHVKQTASAQKPLHFFTPPIKKWEMIQDLSDLESTGLPDPIYLHPLAAKLSKKKVSQRLSSINSRLGMMKHAESYQFRKESLEQLCHNTSYFDMDLENEHTFEWKNIVYNKNFTSIKAR